MAVRRAVAAAATAVVAVVLALAVPVSQLRTFRIVTTCCCPNPAHCHCPPDKPDHSSVPEMRTCHKSSVELVSPQAPGFTPAEVALAAAAPRVAIVRIAAPAAPGPAPAPDEPYGPS